MSIAALLLPLAGCFILAFYLWSRRGASPAARWWVGNHWHEHGILFGLPGLVLLLVSAGPLSAYSDGPGILLWFTLPTLIGLALVAGAALVLPIPRWLRPPWQRPLDERSRR